MKLKLGPGKESQSRKAAAGAEKATKVDNKAGDEVEKKEGDTTVEGGPEGGDSGTLQPGTGTEEDETKSGDVE